MYYNLIINNIYLIYVKPLKDNDINSSVDSIILNNRFKNSVKCFI